MIKGDRIKLIKSMGEFTNVGEICEVVKVDEDGVISFRFGRNGAHLGCMSYNEFEKYFELVKKEEPKKHKWSKWAQKKFCYRDLNSANNIRVVYYRENGKKVQVKLPGTNLRSEATCCKEDKFDFNKGFELAKKRLLVKILKKEVEEFSKNM